MNVAWRNTLFSIVFIGLLAALVTGFTLTIVAPGNSLDFVNVSGLILVNATGIDNEEASTNTTMNVTFSFVNLSNGAYVRNMTIFNSSVGQTTFANTTFNTTELLEGRYTINLTAYNASGQQENFSGVTNITVDNTAPALTIVTPATFSNFSFSSNNQTFNITLFDPLDISQATLGFSNGTKGFNLTLVNASGNWGVVQNTSRLAEGALTITAYANDTAGNLNDTQTITINVDRSAPQVVFSNPANSSNLSGTVPFNVSVLEELTDVNTVIMQFQNGSLPFNETASNASGSWNVNLDTTRLAEGAHNVLVFANDTLANMNSTTNITITVDNVLPNVTFANPANFRNFTIASLNQSFNVTILELNGISSAWLRFTNGSGAAFNVSLGNVSGNWNTEVNVSALAQGATTVTAYANDTAGNINQTSTLSITLDDLAPNVTFIAPSDGDFKKEDFVINMTIEDFSVRSVQYKLINGSNESHVIIDLTSLSNVTRTLWNATIDISTLNESNYTLLLNATDYGENSNATQLIEVGMDLTDPGVSEFSCSDVDEGADQSCTCTATDNSESFGGSVSTSIESLSTTTSGTRQPTCTATDASGRTATDTTTYTVSSGESAGGSGGSGGGVSNTVPGTSEKKVWSSINAGETATVNVRNGAVGVTEVSFDVEEKIFGAWVKVEKKDSLPSTVATFSGKVYRNLQITKSAVLKDSAIKNPTVDFKVEKAWLTQEGLTKNNVALYRYNSDQWGQLQTTVEKEDDAYVHFTAKTPGFSYFVIAEKGKAEEVVVETEEVAGAEEAAPEEEAEATAEGEESAGAEGEEAVTEGEPAKRSSPWKILLALVVIGVAAWAILKLGNKGTK